MLIKKSYTWNLIRSKNGSYLWVKVSKLNNHIGHKKTLRYWRDYNNRNINKYKGDKL